MDRGLIESFAGAYPGSKGRPAALPQMPPKPQNIRTPLSDIMLSRGDTEGYAPSKNLVKNTITGVTTGRKMAVVIAIALLGAFMFSATAYTLSDHVLGNMGMEMFDPTHGQPGMIIIIIHTLVFLLGIYIILKIGGMI